MNSTDDVDLRLKGLPVLQAGWLPGPHSANVMLITTMMSATVCVVQHASLEARIAFESKKGGKYGLASRRRAHESHIYFREIGLSSLPTLHSPQAETDVSS